MCRDGFSSIKTIAAGWNSPRFSEKVHSHDITRTYIYIQIKYYKIIKCIVSGSG
jgi:hypothetical protein